MFHKRRNFMLMSAIAAAFSAGGSAIAHAEHQLANSATGQVVDFDSKDAADNFLANVADAADWAPTGKSAKEAPAELETKVYGDGTGATGTAPLPDAAPETDPPAPAPEPEAAPAPAAAPAPKSRKAAKA